MSFSTGLQSKIVRLWDAADITGVSDNGTVTSWTDRSAGDAATTADTGIIYHENAFGTHPGLFFPQPYAPSLLSPTSPVSGVRAVFALARADPTILPSVIGNCGFVVGFTDPDIVRGGGDATLGIETRFNFNAGVDCYEDGRKVGLALNRRSYPVVLGTVLESTATVSALGGFQYGGFGGTIGAVILLNDVPTDAEVAEITSYLRDLGPISEHARPTRMALFFGDSLTSQDAGSTPSDHNSTYPGLVARSLGTGDLTCQNFGWYGCQASNVLTVVQNGGTRSITAAVSAGYTETDCIILIGCNDIYNGGSPTTTANTVQSICTTLRTAGATRIVLCTLTARVPGDDLANQAAYDANASTYNSLLVNMVPTFADAIVRLDLDAELGGAGSQFDSTYFVADHVHFTAAGISRQAAAVEAQAFAPLSSSSSHSSVSSGSSSSSSSHGHSESSSSSTASTHSSASSSSSSSAPLLFPETISPDIYLAIAQYYAEAYEGQIALITPIDAAVQQLRCQDDVNVTIDLLPTFDTASKLITTKYEAVDGYLGAVRALQRHVEATSGLSVADSGSGRRLMAAWFRTRGRCCRSWRVMTSTR